MSLPSDLASKDVATGRWRMILKDAGLTDKQLSGAQTACPLCEGRTRFRFDDKESRGTYYCNHCGSGDGFKLYCAIRHVDFKTAVAEIAKAYAGMKAEPAKPKPNMRQLLSRIWNGATPAALPIRRYLAGRGITDVPEDVLRHLRYDPECRWRDGSVSGNAPAMLARVWCAGKPVTIHRTYLTTDVPNRKMILPHDGEPMKGAYIPLGRPGRVMGIAEGIETVLSAGQLAGWTRPCWATVSAVELSRFAFPEGLEELHIYGDNDASFTGQAAAYVCARRAYSKKINATVHLPDRPGMDWNDVLREGGAAETQPRGVPARDGGVAASTC